MSTPDQLGQFEGDQAEAAAQAALERLRRGRETTSAQEFVSGRDALEDAWAEESSSAERDEGW